MIWLDQLKLKRFLFSFFRRKSSPSPPPSARLTSSMSPSPLSSMTSPPTSAAWPVRSSAGPSTPDAPLRLSPSWRRSRMQLPASKSKHLKTFLIHAYFTFHPGEWKRLPKTASTPWPQRGSCHNGSSFLWILAYLVLFFPLSVAQIRHARFSECTPSYASVRCSI